MLCSLSHWKAYFTSTGPQSLYPTFSNCKRSTSLTEQNLEQYVVNRAPEYHRHDQSVVVTTRLRSSISGTLPVIIYPPCLSLNLDVKAQADHPEETSNPKTTASKPSPSILLLPLKITTLQIPRHLRQPNHKPIQLPPHLNLTPQSTRLRQPKGQIQHIILIVLRFSHLIVIRLAFNDDMTCRTRTAPAAGTFHF